VCIARMVDAGLCRFDQSVIQIVPMLRHHFDPGVTLGALLSHTAGLGDYIDDDAELPFAGMDVAKLDCVSAFLPQVLCVPRLVPGAFYYSSAGYILLGLMIETLTGTSFPAAISHWVTEPAGLRSTGFPPLDKPSVGMAVGYLPDDRPNFEHLPRVGGPDGGIVTNVADVQRLFDRLGSGDFVNETSRQYLWREVGHVSENVAYGCGFYINKACGESWYGHTGSDPGLSARAAFAPASDSSIVLLCNRQSVAFKVFRLALQWLHESPDRSALKFAP
jgi:CubicO group peptidase (beta-lactamase class C family)